MHHKAAIERNHWQYKVKGSTPFTSPEKERGQEVRKEGPSTVGDACLDLGKKGSQDQRLFSGAKKKAKRI